MLYTEQSVRAAVREEGGRSMLYLAEGDRLTPAAWDLLRRENIVTAKKKPEHMTHLDRETVVCKTHPRIALRGKLDSLQSEILLLQKEPGAPIAALEDMLRLVRELVRAEVLGHCLAEYTIGGMDENELHERSHQPQKCYGVGHFLPSASDSVVLLRLNHLRTTVRETELAAWQAFLGKDKKLSRTDIPTALNRLSSACWVLCLAEKGGKEDGSACRTGDPKDRH